MNITLTRAAACFALLALNAPLALAQEDIDERRSLDADASVEIQNMQGSITVTGSDIDGIVIRGRLGEGARKLEVEGDERRLKIKVDYPESGGGWRSWWGGGAVGDSDLRIELPRGVSLSVSTVSASIEVDNVDGPRLSLETVSGRVRATSASPEVEADSVSGDITLDLGAATELDLESVSGDIELRGIVNGRLKAESVSGDLDLQPQGRLKDARVSVVSGDVLLDAALDGAARAVINSLSGDVVVSLPSDASAALRIETFSGRIDSAVGKVEKEEYGPGARLNHRLGAGEADLRLESFSGNVRFRLK
ncbi:DUF4097 family beta strand repeat-containing protein [Pseudomarimonas salicorniae]|uniref:DUF4097 domain-containing protein n=1 Tax=Pseudomarimonas salicorniae TaxID=2933270 RepID=A0ABT0GC63_9GAMM|nr:DUF4097 family beta strand repeat-containing protein [Lysobacter sp. CAU 1642]MCK7592135.1 DUF4097 domain-containing protein [Lysobacter sp. CAU 1642]